MPTQKHILAAEKLISAQSGEVLSALVTVIVQTLLQASVGQVLFNTITVMEVTLTGVVTKIKVGKKFFKLTGEKWVATKKPKK